MRIYVDQISKNDEIPNCLPSKMIERVGPDCVPEQDLKSDWPHDAGILLVYELARVAPSPADNELMHGTYFHGEVYFNQF